MQLSLESMVLVDPTAQLSRGCNVVGVANSIMLWLLFYGVKPSALVLFFYSRLHYSMTKLVFRINP